MTIKKTKKKKSIMFVCTGNTCRSPMMEMIFFSYVRRHRRDVVVASCGVLTDNNLPMSHNAIVALGQLDSMEPQALKRLDKFVSTKWQPLFVDKYDLVVCMTARHRDILGRYDNVLTLGEIINKEDIDDPYGCDIEVYKNVVKTFVESCPLVLDRLVNDMYC